MAESSRAPLIALRIPRELDERLRAEVKASDSTISDFVRVAIEHRLGDSPEAMADADITARRIAAVRTKAAKRGPASRCEHRVPSGSFCARCDSIVP